MSKNLKKQAGSQQPIKQRIKALETALAPFYVTGLIGLIFHVEKLRPDDSVPFSELLDEFTHNLGLAGLGEMWQQIERAEAEPLARRILHRDLLQGGERMPEAQADPLAEQFFSLFCREPVLYFTNDVYGNLTQSLVDTGIICLDSQYIGILWAESED